MAPNTTFESLNFNPFIVNNSLNDNSQDRDVNFFHDNIFPVDTDYISSDDFSGNLEDFAQNSFSVLHLNIRSLNKNFESFAELYKSLSFKFATPVFQKRGLMMKISVKTHFFNLKATVCCMKTEKIEEVGE